MTNILNSIKSSLSLWLIGSSTLLSFFLLVAFQQPTAPISPIGEAMSVQQFYTVADSLLLKRDFWAATELITSIKKDAQRANDKPLDAACSLVSGKIYLASNQLSFTKSISAFEKAIQALESQDTAVWQLTQSRLGLAQSLFSQWDSYPLSPTMSYGEQSDMLKIDSLLQAVIDALGRAHPLQIDALFLKGLNQLHMLNTRAAIATIQPIRALQRRYATYKKEYDYLLEANIKLYQGQAKKAAVYLEKATELLENKPASDFGKQQLCRAYLQLSDAYAEMDSMLLATECAQRVLIAMSAGFEAPDNLLPNPEFEQLQHLPLCIDALLRKAKYIKSLDKTGFAAYNCTHLAAEISTHLQHQVWGKHSLFVFKFRMMHAFSDALKESYALYQSTEDTTFIADALYLIDREKSIQFWLQIGFSSDSLLELEQDLAAQTWFYTKEAVAAKVRGDSMAHLLFEQRKTTINSLRESVVEQLLKTKEPYLALKYSPSITSLQAVQKKLAKDELILQYFNGTDSSYLLAISTDKFDFRCLSSRDSMSKLTKEFDKAVFAANKISDFGTEVGPLSKLLLPEDIVNYKRLIIIPDFGLFHIPFEVLNLPGTSPSADFKSNAYLFTQHSVSYQYSLSAFLAWSQKKIAPASYRLLALAMATQKHPHVQLELDYLSNRFSATILKDSTASMESFFSQAKQYGFLHFSGALWLDPTKIEGLKLNAALVLLNSTETSAFENEYAALGFSFTQAGAASVISSLWHSEADASTKLLELFYERLQQGLSKDEAMRQAKISYLEQMDESDCLPKFWAQYQVYGDYRNVAVSEPISYIWWYLLPILALGAIGWWAMQGLRQRKRF